MKKLIRQEASRLKARRLDLGNRNLIGARVTEVRKALEMKQAELLAKL